MSRLRRIAGNCRFFFVTTNLRRGLPPFTKPEYTIFANALSDRRIRDQCELCAYCFLPDHIHAIVFPHETTTVSSLLQRFKLSTSRSVQSHREANGPLWQARFYDRVIRNKKEFDEVFDYIHMNPVRKGMASRPEDWPWSSAGWFLKESGPVAVDSMRLPSDAHAWL
jgi:REP element-mobilizing transposase RayT